MSTQALNIDYFIAKFSAIPEQRWCVGRFYRPAYDQCCALGHCGIRPGNAVYETEESYALEMLFRDAGLPFQVSSANDNGLKFHEATQCEQYQHLCADSSKGRILAVLRHIKQNQTPTT